MTREEIKNPLLRSFLAISTNHELYQTFCKEPTDSNRKSLEQNFNEFYRKIRVLSYFSKTIHFTAQKYDKKLRLINNKFLLTLDSPISSGGSENTQTMKELMMDKRVENDVLKLNITLEDYIQDGSLRNAICSLTEKQKEVLYLAFIKDFSDTEISKRLHVSQQAISKTKINALKKVRRVVGV